MANGKGYIYVATHERMPGLVKIGCTTNLKLRVSALNTSLPDDFEIRIAFQTENQQEVEKKLKETLVDLQTGSKNTKEFYRCSPKHVRELIDQLVDDGIVTGRFLSELEIKVALCITR